MRKFCVVLLLALMAAAPAWGAAFSGDDHAKVAFDSINKRYMRVYRQTSTGPSSTIRAMIFNADGSVYSDNPIRSSLVCDRPAVAFDNSSHFLVVWSEDVGGNEDIYGQLVSATGVNSGALIRFTADAGSQVQPSVACDSSGRFFVVWTDTNGDVDIKGKFMAAGGAPDAVATPVCDDVSAQDFSDVAFSPALGRFMVVWKDSRMVNNSDVWGALFNGTVRISKFKVSRNTDTFDQDSPRVACTPTGDSFLVCFRDSSSNSIMGQMVTGSGAGILNGPSIAISAVGQSADDDFALSVAFGSDRYLVTWIDMRNSGSANDIYGQYLTATGQPIDANFAVNTEAVDQFNPYVAGNPADGSFLAGWGYKTGTTVYHFKSTILNAPVSPDTPGSGGGGGGGCFIASAGSGWQMLAWALSGLLAAVGIRRR